VRHRDERKDSWKKRGKTKGRGERSLKNNKNSKGDEKKGEGTEVSSSVTGVSKAHLRPDSLSRRSGRSASVYGGDSQGPSLPRAKGEEQGAN